MAGGNRTLIIKLPEELVWLIDNVYQKSRVLPSRQAAIRELLETHPRIAQEAERMYTGGMGKEHESGG